MRFYAFFVFLTSFLSFHHNYITSLCFWRNLNIFKLPIKIRFYAFFVFLTAFSVISQLTNRNVCEYPLWTLRGNFRRLGVEFEHKKQILGLWDPTFLALGVKPISYLKYWECGDLQHVQIFFKSCLYFYHVSP